METKGYETLLIDATYEYINTVIPESRDAILEEIPGGWELYGESKRGNMCEWNFRRPRKA